MKQRFSEEQIIGFLKEADAGMPAESNVGKVTCPPHNSSATGGNDIFNPESQISDKGWGQFELFVSEKSDVIIFAQPGQLGFDGIVQIVAVGNARRILDLREVPFISFGNETREVF